MKRAAYKGTGGGGALALAAQAWGAEFEVRDSAGHMSTAFALVGPDSDLAVVEVCGPLTQHNVFIWDNYDDIRARVSAAMGCAQAKAVVLKMNSPGGDVAGCFELARELAASKTKRLIAFADGMAASAAYAIAAAADEIVVSSTSFVGSIGVIEAMCDQTAADKAQGLNYVLVASGARKADGNPHVAISKEAVSSMQGQVDGLAELFFTLVGDMRSARGLTADKARALQAGMFFGADAVSKGLADRVMTWNELVATAATDLTGVAAMAKATYMDEARKALKQAAEEGNEMAKKMLAMEDAPADDEEKKDKADGKKAESDEDKKAKAEADEKKAKAEADEKKPAAKKADADGDDDGDKKAKAVSEAAFSALAEVQSLKAEIAKRDNAKAVSDLFATRPDFDDKMRATLSAMPLDKIREACETWPRVGVAANPRAAAANTVGTRGATTPVESPPAEVDFIDRAMGLRTPGGLIKHDRNTLELGVMTPAQARAKVAELDKAKAAAK